jgi:hypothetical protein
MSPKIETLKTTQKALAGSWISQLKQQDKNSHIVNSVRAFIAKRIGQSSHSTLGCVKLGSVKLRSFKFRSASLGGTVKILLEKQVSEKR